MMFLRNYTFLLCYIGVFTESDLTLLKPHSLQPVIMKAAAGRHTSMIICVLDTNRLTGNV